MGYSLELKSSSRQHQTSKIVKEKFQSPQANQSLKFQDKFKVENSIGDLHTIVRPNVNEGSLFQRKFSAGHQKQRTSRKATKDDELVKHMSNLPGYLQRIEKGENLQEKALNFGVLDWERLEKWKHNQKHVPERGSTNASSTSCNSSLVSSIGSSTLSSRDQNGTRIRHSKQHLSPCSNISSSHKGDLSQGAKLARGKVMCLKDFETSPNSNLGRQRKLHYTDKPFSRSYSQTLRKKKDVDQKMSEMGTSSSNLRKHGVSLSSKKQMSSSDAEIEKRVEVSEESDSDLARKHCSDKHKNIVLLLPTNLPQNSSSEAFQLPEGRKLFDEKSTVNFPKRISGDFSPEKIHLVGLPSEIPHSCPLPCREELYTKSDMKPQSMNITQGMELPSNACHMSPCSREKPTMQSEGRSETKPMNSAVIEMSKKQDLETAKGRNPSPNRRFTLGLARMSRSFSFKEGSALPQLSSTYVTVRSGPAKSESSACSVNSSREKANANSRARSSPLRRLLDPLLRPKAANLLQSAETVQALEGSLCRPLDFCESLHNEKHEASTIQAVLQLTMKNGLPLFKFVVNNKSTILAATVKELTASGKDDSSWIYTFYSLHKIKKKSGSWMSQGSKGNSSSYVYNVVGQMNVSSSHFTESEQNLKNQYTVKESVLVGVDLRQGKEETSEFMPNRELAAIVIKIPIENLNHGGDSNKNKDLMGKGFKECLPEDRCSCKLGENGDPCSTTVILPSGVHGLPSRGAPSPLIDRWKSSGSCDCGGWDIGCKLQILTSQDHCCWTSRLPNHCNATNRFDLFVQGGGYQEKKPIFSMVPFKEGIYSVEFNATISLIQAFSICAAVTSQQKSPVLSEAIMSEAGLSEEPIPDGCDGVKTPTLLKGDAGSKFVPYPPLSPVGRV